MPTRMDKLRNIYDAWVNYGHKPSYASPSDMHVLVNVYHELNMNKKSVFFSSTVRRILEDCGINVKPDRANFIAGVNFIATI